VPGLLDPLRVRGLTFLNRIVMPPMQSGRADFSGAVTRRLINFYARRSGWVGLPVVEHAFVSTEGRIGPKQLGIFDDSLIGGFRELVDAIHDVGAPAVVQISHAGAVANKKIIGTTPVGPCASGKARMLEKAELYSIIDAFVLAAGRAVDAGFDGVELHGAHGYLLNQFFTPLLNQRVDEFGGCLENRIRFPLLVVEKVRQCIGDKVLLYRLGADDLAPMGTHIEDAVEFAVKLEEAGVDVLDVSGGMCGSEPKQIRGVQGYFVPQASRIKQAVGIPVIGVGGIVDAAFADGLVRDGLVDFVAVGRALWHDSDWAKKAVEFLSL
jgi:NADPH2 dehydrogenase